jgi:predicted Zn-dependent protease
LGRKSSCFEIQKNVLICKQNYRTSQLSCCEQNGGFFMKKSSILWLFIFSIFLSCQTVPITGRQQLSLIPSESILNMSYQQYNDFLAKHTVVRNTPEADAVKRVGQRIQQSVERYMTENNMADRLEGYNWEFNLIQDDTVNAWAMPGGKVAVYTGILPVAGDEAGLAVVMGHEIAHAIARHGDERMSQGLIAQMGGVALSTALSKNPKGTTDLFMTAYGLGSQIGVLLPYGRLQESEADHLGLIFMAMAGYDPRTAVNFWNRMASAKQGASPPEFLSTHPADATRIKNIESLIPEAMKYYKG